MPANHDARGSPLEKESPGSLGLPDPKPARFHCVTEYVKAEHIFSARAGHAGNCLPRWKPGSVVTYTVVEESFPSSKWAIFAQDALVEAAQDWTNRHVGVQFRLVEQGERAVFALKYRDFRAPSQFLAESFFPDFKYRIMYVFRVAFHREYRRYMANVFRHELGHVLGLRHEGAAIHEPEVPSVELGLGNGLSIMNYFTDVSNIHPIHESDVLAVRKLCSLNEETFDGFEVVTVDPDALGHTNFNDSDQSSFMSSDLVSNKDSDCASSEELPDPSSEELDTNLEMLYTNPMEPGTNHAEPRVNHKRPETSTDEPSNADPRDTNLASPINQPTVSPSDLHRLSSEQTIPTTSEDGGAPNPNTLEFDLSDALIPEAATEDMFCVQNNPFAFSPGQLSKLLNPISHRAFQALGGLAGLERGLRTDRKAGLSVDETHLDGSISFEIATNQGVPRHGDLSKNASLHSGDGQIPALGLGSVHDASGFADRKRIFKDNRIPERKGKSALKLAWGVYQGRVFLILLTLAAIVSIAWDVREALLASRRGDEPKTSWAEGVAILVCVILVVTAETFNQWTKERRLARLNEIRNFRLVKVIRSGRTTEIPVLDVLVGDVVLISAGDIIPADGVLIEGYGVTCDESHCTGESDLMPKVSGDEVFTILDDAARNRTPVGREVLRLMDPFLHHGARVTEGCGSFLATAVGIYSSYGRLMMSIMADPDDDGPQTRRLHHLVLSACKLGTGAALLLLTASVIKFLAGLPYSTLTPEEKGRSFFALLVTGIAVSVIAGPLFLSQVGPIVMAFARTRMVRDNSLVLSGKAGEVVGNVTSICTGVTGILTQNKMTVVAAMLGATMGFGNADFPPDDDASTLGSAHQHAETMPDLVPKLSCETKQLLIQSIVINSTAFEGDLDGEVTFIGPKTEVALMTFSRNFLGAGPVSEERHNALVSRQVPFTSQAKFMATTDDQIACRDMTLLAIFGIRDPIRAGVSNAVMDCRRAGITVRMVTGDNLVTALAIARDIGLYRSDSPGLFLEGPIFRRLDEPMRREVVPRLVVLARASGEDKRILIQTLRELGETAAVIGGDSDDGPALKMADIGFAKGIDGTEVARMAADVIVMDDNFCSIVKCISWGRAAKDGVQKFLQFKLTAIITAVCLTFVSAMASDTGETPVLNAAQLLWATLLTDLAVLALATDPPTKMTLDRKPDRRSSPIITCHMAKMILGQTICQLVITLVLYFGWFSLPSYHQDTLNVAEAKLRRNTFVFNTFIWLQIFNALNSRRLDNRLNVFKDIMGNWRFFFIGKQGVQGCAS
ncbi:hypothetical protein NEMBOFW57_010039 [Staphylotrichum longicolle]|uniref:P-type Ca(2+) transporter n=1 Tax=Staphylotrichum longicolle TaxID=669026 RepID=A0AAD4ETT9_9PEZI|nr:hypothetical protein NEMBOFW57_010039 [Staphylotrichum longicolle]